MFERRSRKRKPRVKSIYKLLPSSVQPVDARHLLARYGRLSSVLLRADSLAELLAGRALTVKLNSTASDWMPGGQPASALSSFHVSHQAHGNNPEWAEPPRGVRHDNAGMSINCRSAQAEGGADNLLASPSGPPGSNPGLTRPTGSSLIPAHAGTSQSKPQPDPRFRGDERTALSATHREIGSSLEHVPCEQHVRGNKQESRKAGDQNKDARRMP